MYIGYREVMHGAVRTCLVPLDSPRSQTAMVKNAQLAVHGGAGGETCMDVLVTSADNQRP